MCASTASGTGRPRNSGELADEAYAAFEPPRRAVDTHAHVRRQVMAADASAEHHHLVEPLSERGYEAEGVREHRMIGVQLGDEHQSQRASRPRGS